jgi:hypothetical protein
MSSTNRVSARVIASACFVVGSFVSGTAPTAWAQSKPLFPAQQYATSASTSDVVIADVNGDGVGDMVSSQRGGDDVRVRIGTSFGAFGTPTSTSVSFTPEAVEMSDLNGDGKLDFVTVNSFFSDLNIALGLGNGTFTPATTVPAGGGGPQDLALGDVDGDGKTDAVVTNYNSPLLSWLKGNGAGSFGVPQTVGAGMRPERLVLADLDNDGDLDVASGLVDADAIGVYRNNGLGAFTTLASVPTGDAPRGIAVGDLDGDGKPDLATANYSGQTVSAARGLGAGAFAAPTTTALTTTNGPAFARDLALVDLDGDGKRDVLVAASAADRMLALIGNGSARVRRGWGIPRRSQSGSSRPRIRERRRIAGCGRGRRAVECRHRVDGKWFGRVHAVARLSGPVRERRCGDRRRGWRR